MLVSSSKFQVPSQMNISDNLEFGTWTLELTLSVICIFPVFPEKMFIQQRLTH